MLGELSVVRVNSRKHAVKVNHAATVWASAATMEAVVLSLCNIDAEIDWLLIAPAYAMRALHLYFTGTRNLSTGLGPHKVQNRVHRKAPCH